MVMPGFGTFRDGKDVWVTVKPICDLIGVSFAREREKIWNNKTLKSDIVRRPGRDGKIYKMLCLHPDSFEIWVKNLRPKLIRNKENYERVVKSFQARRTPASGEDQGLQPETQQRLSVVPLH